MAHLIYIRTTRFDDVKEEPNPYNPREGKELLSWLGAQLSTTGWQVTKPDPEDWGWYITAHKSGESYMIGASDMDDESTSVNWMIQVHKNRTFLEKLTGKNKLSDDDFLTHEIESIVRREPGTTKVEVEMNA